ncbi:hypothetical protein CRENBAI_020550 [Crenichthys baileyi]|uniref:Uncharacterized protein n=1 Tax=Crenichthys baileyi TaxID=28760 RepID=A0AAV9QSQ5_9TELE
MDASGLVLFRARLSKEALEPELSLSTLTSNSQPPQHPPDSPFHYLYSKEGREKGKRGKTRRWKWRVPLSAPWSAVTSIFLAPSAGGEWWELGRGRREGKAEAEEVKQLLPRKPPSLILTICPTCTPTQVEEGNGSLESTRPLIRSSPHAYVPPPA